MHLGGTCQTVSPHPTSSLWCPSGMHSCTSSLLPSYRLDYGTNCPESWNSPWWWTVHRPRLRWRCRATGWSDRDAAICSCGILSDCWETRSALMISGKKTKIQNLGSGNTATDITTAGNTVEAVTEFRYLGSIQSTSGRCYPDIYRPIGV